MNANPPNARRTRVVLGGALFLALTLVIYFMGLWPFRGSEPGTGLSAKIEYFDFNGEMGPTILLRLINEGPRPVSLPIELTNDPAYSGKNQAFELQIKGVTAPWRHSRWLFRSHIDGMVSKYDGRMGQVIEDSVEAPLKVLGPGQAAVLYLSAGVDEIPEDVSEIKVLVSAPQHWSRTVETPAFPAGLFGDRFEKFAHTLDFPDSFPVLSRFLFEGGNLPEGLPEVILLAYSNADLFSGFVLYRPNRLRSELERRLALEKSLPMKLLLASEAAALESEPAISWLLECAHSTDYQTLRNTHEAFAHLIRHYHGEVPPWIVRFAQEAALDDPRPLTGSEKGGSPQTIGHLNDITWDLVRAKCPEVVPMLLERIRRSDRSSDAASALGDIGDTKVVPALLEYLNTVNHSFQDDNDYSMGPFEITLDALVRLRAPEAVHFLLQHLSSPARIAALGKTNDVRAIEPLQAIIASNGQIIREGKPFNPARDVARLKAAKIAVACLDRPHRNERLFSLLSDPSFDDSYRLTIAWQLRENPSEEMIPQLIKIIREDRDGLVIGYAITAMGKIKTAAAVTGLMDCLDANFNGKSARKSLYKPRLFRAAIANSLYEITGQPLPADKQIWQRWWADEGQKLAWMPGHSR